MGLHMFVFAPLSVKVSKFLPLLCRSSQLSQCCLLQDNTRCILSPHRYGDHLCSIHNLRLKQTDKNVSETIKSFLTFFQETFVRELVPDPSLRANQINTVCIFFLTHYVLKVFYLLNQAPNIRINPKSTVNPLVLSSSSWTTLMTKIRATTLKMVTMVNRIFFLLVSNLCSVTSFIWSTVSRSILRLACVSND